MGVPGSNCLWTFSRFYVPPAPGPGARPEKIAKIFRGNLGQHREKFRVPQKFMRIARVGRAGKCLVNLFSPDSWLEWVVRGPRVTRDVIWINLSGKQRETPRETEIWSRETRETAGNSFKDKNIFILLNCFPLFPVFPATKFLFPGAFPVVSRIFSTGIVWNQFVNTSQGEINRRNIAIRVRRYNSARFRVHFPFSRVLPLNFFAIRWIASELFRDSTSVRPPAPGHGPGKSRKFQRQFESESRKSSECLKKKVRVDFFSALVSHQCIHHGRLWGSEVVFKQKLALRSAKPARRYSGPNCLWTFSRFYVPPAPPRPRPPGHGSRKPRKVQRQIQKRSQWRKKGPGQLFNAGFEPVHPPWSIAGVKSVSDGFVFVVIITTKTNPSPNYYNSFVVFFRPPPSTLGDKITSPLPPPPCTMMVGPHVRPRCEFSRIPSPTAMRQHPWFYRGRGGRTFSVLLCRRVYGCDRNKNPDSAVALLICEKCANSL